MVVVVHEAQRMAVEVLDGVQGKEKVLRLSQGRMGAGVVADVQMVPSKGPVGLAS